MSIVALALGVALGVFVLDKFVGDPTAEADDFPRNATRTKRLKRSTMVDM